MAAVEIDQVTKRFGAHIAVNDLSLQVPGGVVYGATDARGTAPARDTCSPDDLAATIFQRLGFGPHHEVGTPGGRPVPIFREGKVLPLAG